MIWTKEDLELMRVLFAEGVSANNAGNVLGRSRNAIIGMRHRMGFSKPRPKPAPKDGTMPKRKRGRPTGQPTMSRRVARKDITGIRMVMVTLKEQCEDAFVPFSERHVSLMGLKSHHCRWPLDDPDNGILFCGENRFDGSYCRLHSRMAYQR